MATKAAPAAVTGEDVPLPSGQARRRQRIVEEAYALILASDDDNVQIRDVADRAGVALGTAYRYFGSKDRLFAEAYARWVERHADEIERAAGRSKPGLDRTRVMARKLFDVFTTEPQFMRVVRGLRPSVEPGVHEVMQRAEARTVRLFAGAVDGLSPRDEYVFALVVCSVVWVVMEQVLTGPVDLKQGRRSIDDGVTMIFRSPTGLAGT